MDFEELEDVCDDKDLETDPATADEKSMKDGFFFIPFFLGV